jgi:PAS domain S-box-containing protein
MVPLLPTRVLLVDGNPETATKLDSLLEEQPSSLFNVAQAGGLIEAVGLLPQHEFGLFVVGSSLDDASSLEAVTHLRDAEPGVPILVLYRRDSVATTADYRAAGAQFCVRSETLTGPLLGHAIRVAEERKKRLEPTSLRSGLALQESEARFRAAFEHAPIGMALLDPEGRWTRVNRELSRIIGYSQSELEAMTWRDLAHPGEADAAAAAHRRLLAGQVPVLQIDMRWVHKHGHTLQVSASSSVVRSGAGRPLYVVAQVRDVTRQRRIEAGWQFLVEAAHLLAASLDQGATLRTVAQLAVPRLADGCLVEVREGGTRFVDVAAVDPAKEALLTEIQGLYPVDRASPLDPLGRVLETGRSVLWGTIGRSVLQQMASDPRHLQMLQDLAPISGMIVPLSARGRILGAVLLMSSESGRQYDDDDLAIARDLAHSAALAIDNARLFRRQDAPPSADGVAAGQAASSTGFATARMAGPVPVDATSAAHHRPETHEALRELSGQEQRVLGLSARGYTASEIADAMDLAQRTVETYRSRAMRKLDLANRADLIALALRTGLLSR